MTGTRPKLVTRRIVLKLKKKKKRKKKRNEQTNFSCGISNVLAFLFFFHCLNTRRVTRHNNSTPYLLTPEPYPDCHLRISSVQRVSIRVALLDKRSFAVPTSRLTSTTETVKTKRKNSPMVIIGNGTVASLDQSTTKISV